ncbi:SDR family NAD(P)-dependent oxidoreductase [Pseudomonas sp.]|uniref:SDR family NAD(P)-dependent oxidoreductase n=1 Tax=Pseudomonas sp. TaxID=306 RepID=UPI002731F823|nr:SDR family oxidoreductase [Pseudomonas sp.]MDP2243773.1 SDR family oxidoreductase [Pseudomonas sp.]
MPRLQDKIALVIGADSHDNMGQDIARRFVAEGARVVVAGRNVDEMSRFADEIKGSYFQCDITSKTDLAALTAHVLTWGGGLDIAVNTAGWGLTKGFLETSEGELERITALQFKGPFLFLQAVIEAMHRGGSIIQISSATTQAVIENYAAYIGTKAGIDHVLRCVANEFGSRGIRANSISPGLTETPMTAQAMATPGVHECFLGRYPLGRIGTKADIAAAAVWLASDECFMTGENLQINGGLQLRGNPTSADVGAAVAKALAAKTDA